MNEALDAALRTNPRAQERRQYYQTEVRFPEDRAREAVRAEFRTEFLLRLCDCARDARNPNEKALDKVLSTNPRAEARLESLRKEFPLERAKEMVKAEFRSEFLWRVSQLEEDQTSLDEINLPEAPLYPEFRVKQFVREYRLAPVTAAADRLHAVLCPPTGHPTPEQARDAAREAFANHSPDEMNQLRTLYRERWLRGSNGGEPQDLDGAIYAALGGDLAIHDQCEAILNPAQAASLARLHAITDTLHGNLSPPTGQPTAEQVRDAVREACANRSPEEVNELRLDYRRRWSTDLDAEVAAKLGMDRRLRRECQALLHSRRGSKPDDGPN